MTARPTDALRSTGFHLSPISRPAPPPKVSRMQVGILNQGRPKRLKSSTMERDVTQSDP